MFGVFLKPSEASKNMPNYLFCMIYLLLTAVLLFFTAKIAGLTWLKSLYVLLGVIVTVILGAFAFNIILWVWNKNNFLTALNVLVLPWFLLSLAAFLMSLLSLIPYVGSVLAALVTLVAVPYAIALQLKLIMDSFKWDLVTSGILLLVLYIGAGATIMGLIGMLALQLVSALGFGLLPIAFP